MISFALFPRYFRFSRYTPLACRFRHHAEFAAMIYVADIRYFALLLLILFRRRMPPCWQEISFAVDISLEALAAAMLPPPTPPPTLMPRRRLIFFFSLIIISDYDYLSSASYAAACRLHAADYSLRHYASYAFAAAADSDHPKSRQITLLIISMFRWLDYFRR